MFTRGCGRSCIFASGAHLKEYRLDLLAILRPLLSNPPLPHKSLPHIELITKPHIGDPDNATADRPKAADVTPVNCADYGVMQPVVGYVPLHSSFAAGNVKLRKFWEDDEELWFSTAETIFTIKANRTSVPKS